MATLIGFARMINSPYVHFENAAGTSVYHGKMCPRDGTTLRYSTGNKCIACSAKSSAVQVHGDECRPGVILSPPVHLANRAWA